MLHATERDEFKSTRALKYLQATLQLGLTLENSDKISEFGYVDASYVVHADCKSHSGAAVILGKGIVYAKAAKEKVV